MKSILKISMLLIVFLFSLNAQAQTENAEQVKEEIVDHEKVEKSEVYYYFLWGAIKSKNWEGKPKRVKANELVKAQMDKVNENTEMKSILGGAIQWSVSKEANKEDEKK